MSGGVPYSVARRRKPEVSGIRLADCGDRISENGTHLPMLLACVARTAGRVIELGVGHFSTPVLHAVCEAAGRPLMSLESDKRWVEQFAYMRSSLHSVVYVPDWSDLVRTSLVCDVALVDNVPPQTRMDHVELLRRDAKYIVVHDTEPNRDEGYAFEPVFARFRHRCDDRRYVPWTTAVSDIEPLDWLKLGNSGPS